MRISAEEWPKINCLPDFFEILHTCGYLLDCWAMTERPERIVRRFLPARIRAASYVEFSIPKKTGGTRLICAPIQPLKEIQRALGAMLQALFQPSESAMGFVAGRSIVANARCHLHQSCVLNLDLENFFPSITKAWVRRALERELADRIPSSEVRHLICKLCTIPNQSGIEVLPQGAPTSPVLSNIVLKDLDRRLAAFAGAHGYNYTRYADDITFSHNRPIRRFSPFFMKRIRSIIEEYGLKINDRKTEVSVKGERLEVTGLIVGEKVNVPRNYIKQLRTLLHLWEHYGYERAQIIYNRNFCSGTGKSLKMVIYGKINYLAMVKGGENSTVIGYRNRFRYLVRKHRPKGSHGIGGTKAVCCNETVN